MQEVGAFDDCLNGHREIRRYRVIASGNKVFKLLQFTADTVTIIYQSFSLYCIIRVP